MAGQTDLERKYGEQLKETLETAVLLTISKTTSSREHSLSYTNLQQAELWHDKDRAEKEYRDSEREAHPPDAPGK